MNIFYLKDEFQISAAMIDKRITRDDKKIIFTILLTPKNVCNVQKNAPSMMYFSVHYQLEITLIKKK